MQVEIYPKNIQVTESKDKQLVAVSAPNVAGSSDITLFVYRPFLQGEDYPALVHAWDNKDDDIFDNI
jgi:hypothetical protein